MSSFIYVLASQRNGTLYVGVTNDLARRIDEHKRGVCEGFSKKYRTHFLVYYECYERMDEAIVRDKQLKKWNRAWKVRLIEENNPQWKDLALDLNA